MTTTSGGQPGTGSEVLGAGGGRPQGWALIDRDVRPAWENSTLPEWVNTWLIPMLSGGQKWPHASEHALSKLAQSYAALGVGATAQLDDAGRAARKIVSGCATPSMYGFVGRAQELCGPQAGMVGIARDAEARSLEAGNFAIETQYSKLSVNVAFWVTVVAIAIALFVAFFTAGSSAPLVGPFATAARAAITRILSRLAAMAGREVGATGLARLAVLSGATGRAALLRLLSTPLGKELIEEIGEETFIDAMAQWQQMKMGTRTEWDWKKTFASAVGAGVGAWVGMWLTRPISRVTRYVPGFGGRALTTGVTNAFASPLGSLAANTIVYQQPPGNPFTGEAMLGAFMGGVGRTGTISPFNPDVFTAVTHPLSSLASANDLANAADLARSGDTPPPSSPPPGTGPGPGPNQPGGGPVPTGGMNTAPGGQNTPNTPGSPGRTGQSGQNPQQPGPDPATRTGRNNTTTQPDPNAPQPDPNAAPAPDPNAPPQTPNAPQPQAPNAPQNPIANTGSGQNQAQPPAPDPNAPPAPDPNAPPAPDPNAPPAPDPNAPPAPDPNAQSAPDPNAASAPDPNAASAPDPNAGQGQAPNAASAPDPQAASTPDPGASQGQAPSTGQTSGPNAASAPDPGATQTATSGPDPAAQQTAGTTPDPAVTPQPGQPPTPVPAQGTAQGTTQQTGRQTAQSGTQTGNQTAAATPTAAQKRNAKRAAKKAIDEALLHLAPEGLWLQDGSVLLADDGGRAVQLSAEVLAEAAQSLEQNAKDGAREDRLRAQAAAWLGAEMARATGRPEAEGALDALARLSQRSPQSRQAATEVTRAVLAANPGAGASTLAEENPAHDLGLSPGYHQSAAAELGRRVKALANPQATTSAPRTTTRTPAATPRRRPRPRTSLAVPGTPFAADTRPTPLNDLADPEVRRLITRNEVKPGDFGGEVRSVVWSDSGPQIRVTTESQGTQHFEVRYERPGLDTHGTVTVGAGTATDPHVVWLSPRLDPSLVSTTLVHEITHALLDLAAPLRQGVIRNALGRLSGRTQDACIAARYNEHRHLARRYLETNDPAKQRDLLNLLQVIADDLERRGASAPVSPTVTGDQGVRPPPPPAPETPVAASTRLAQDQADALTQAVAGLDARIADHAETAKKAKEAATQARLDAQKARKQRDKFAPERVRKAEAEAKKQQEIQRRHQRIIRAYADARKAAQAAQESYATLATDLGWLKTATPSVVAALADGLANTEAAAKKLLDAYDTALRKAVPDREILPNAMATGRLPHMTRLTERLNAAMRAQGVDQTFTPDQLQRVLKAHFRRLVTKEGAVLRVGVHHQGELRIKLSTSELVEVLGHPAKASEMMIGRLSQGGLAVAAAMARVHVLKAGAKSKRLLPFLKFLDEGSAIRGFAEGVIRGFGPGANVSHARTRSVNGSSSDYVVGGAVEDNRGESTLFAAGAEWQIDIRTSQKGGWKRVEAVNTGTRSDAKDVRMWVGMAHTDRSDGKSVRMSELEAKFPGAVSNLTKDFPPHLLLAMSGTEEMFEAAVAALGSDAEIGTDVRHQLRTFLYEKWHSQMARSINAGVLGKITKDGRPYARLEVVTRPVYATARRKGVSTDERWKEDLGVAVSNANGGQSFGFSVDGSVSGERAFTSLGDEVEELIDTDAEGNWNAGAGHGRSRSEGVSAGGTAYKPVVDRSMEHQENVILGYTAELRITLESGTSPDPIETEGELHVVVAESAAARADLPFDPAAVMYGPDGRPRRDSKGRILLRDDPEELAKPIKKEMARSIWQGDQRYQIPDAVFSLVTEVTNLPEVLQDALKGLRAAGLLPKIANGRPVFPLDDPLKAASQFDNLVEVADQLSDLRIRTGLNQAIQQNIHFDLTLNSRFHATEHFTVEVDLSADLDTTEVVATTDKKAEALLNIGSNTGVVSEGHGRSAGVNGGVSAGHSPGENTEGAKYGARTGGGVGVSKNSGSSMGDTGNDVTLIETTTKMAVTQTKGQAKVTLRQEGKEPVELSDRPVVINMMTPIDLLLDPSRPPGDWQTMPEDLVDQATLLHVDTRGFLDAARRLLPRLMGWGSPAFHHIAAFLGVHNVSAHPFRKSPYMTRFAVRGQGRFGAAHGRLMLEWKLGQAQFLTSSPLVIGDIFLQLFSQGTSLGTSSNLGVNGGGNYGYQEEDNGGFGPSTGTNGSWNRGHNTSRLLIWGRERLTIDIGQQYLFRASVDFPMSAFDPGDLSGIRTVTVDDRTVLFSVPEEVVLRMYAQGDMQLPLHQVADAVERFLDGILELDRTVAVPLAKRYLMALQAHNATGDPAIPLSDRHTPEALFDALAKLPGMAPLKQAPEGSRMTKASELAAKVRKVILPDHIATRMGMTKFDSAKFTRNGERLEIFDAVLDSIEEVAPGSLLGDPAALDKLDGSLSRKRWRGKIDNILGRGHKHSFTMRVGSTGRTERFTVKIRMELDPNSAEDLGPTKTKVPLDQDYTYEEESVTESVGRSLGTELGGADSETSGGQDASVSTDRNRSRSGSYSQQETSVERYGGPADMHRVKQTGRLIIEVERRPVRKRFWNLRANSRRLADQAIHPGRPAETKVELDVEMVRLIESDEIIPVENAPAVPAPRALTDPRQIFRLPVTTKTETVVTDGSITRNLAAALRAHGGFSKRAMRERMNELEALVNDLALTTLFDRMAGQGGLTNGRLNGPTASGTAYDIGLSARPHVNAVVVGPLDARELGRIHRVQRMASASTGRSRLLPVSRGFGADDADTTLKGGYNVGDQASDRVTTSMGNRDEATDHQRGTMIKVEFHVSYDGTLTQITRTPRGRETRSAPDHLPNVGTATVVVAMFEGEFQQMMADVEAGIPLGSGWAFTPPSMSHGTLLLEGAATAADPLAPLVEARRKAFDERVPVHLTVTEHDGTVRGYLFGPDGTVRSDERDLGFAEAFGTVPELLVQLSRDNNLDLRHLFHTSPVEGTLSDKIRAELDSRNISYAAPAPAFPPASATHASPPGGTPAAGSASQASPGPSAPASGPGTPGASAPSPALPGSPFALDARPASMPDLNHDELAAILLTPNSFGGAVTALSWLADGRTMEIITPQHGLLYVRFTIGDPGAADNARISTGINQDEPLVVVLRPRLHPYAVESTLVHEVSHALQEEMANQQGLSQGVVRSFLPGQQLREGQDHCLTPRLNEHAHLSGLWNRATDAVAQLNLAQAIEAIAADIESRGHPAPPPPWGDGPRVKTVPRQGSIADLLNTGAGPVVDSATAIGALDTSPAALDRLANAAGVTSITPAGPGRFTVEWPGGSLELLISKSDAPPGQVDVYPQLGRPGRLVLEVSAFNATEVLLRTATQIARQSAALPPGGIMNDGSLPADPAIGADDVPALVRVRTAVRALADAPKPLRAQRENELREAAAQAGLKVGGIEARTRLILAARAGQLAPVHVNALYSVFGQPVIPPVRAAAAAVARAAEQAGAEIKVYGDALLDLVVPGRQPVAIELSSHRATRGEPLTATVHRGVARYQVAALGSFGAIERNAAGEAAAMISALLGVPAGAGMLRRNPPADPATAPTTLSVEDHKAIARLREAVRQVDAATPYQRPARLRVLVETAASLGVGDNPHLRDQLPPALADALVRLVDGRGRVDEHVSVRRSIRELLDGRTPPTDRAERARRLANTTGYYPYECLCPDDEPCVCGHRAIRFPVQREPADAP
ncbi:WXG100-like domain-containing protein [Nonomuraea endophytica]|uniref:WXG100-like domain-containing protein n=1 Tax=Nonomuraea endophytica TaxID=714136 RepID=UPI0037C60076